MAQCARWLMTRTRVAPRPSLLLVDVAAVVHSLMAGKLGGAAALVTRRLRSAFGPSLSLPLSLAHNGRPNDRNTSRTDARTSERRPPRKIFDFGCQKAQWTDNDRGTEGRVKGVDQRGHHDVTGHQTDDGWTDDGRTDKICVATDSLFKRRRRSESVRRTMPRRVAFDPPHRGADKRTL